MTEDTVVNITMATVWLILKVSAPMLLISLIVGLLISIFQTITSIQEQTLTFVPKLLGVFLAVMLFGLWIMRNISEFMQYLIENFNVFVNG